MKLETSLIPHFHVILTGQSISEIILLIQGQKVNFKGKITFFKKKAKNVSNTSFSWDFDWKIWIMTLS